MPGGLLCMRLYRRRSLLFVRGLMVMEDARASNVGDVVAIGSLLHAGCARC